MKLFIKIVMLLSLPAFSNAQQNPYWEEWNKEQADSLQLIFYNSANDTIRMGVARSLGFYYQELNYDSALYFHQKQALLAVQLKAKLWEADAIENMGYVLSIQKIYPQSLKAFLNAIQIAEDKETEKNIWQVSRFSKAGDPTLARLVVLAFSRMDLGRLYGFTGNVKEELSNSFEALKIAERVGDAANLANINQNIGFIFIRLNQPDSALTFLKKALAYTKTSGIKRFNGQLLNYFGTIYLKKANYALAKQYFTDAIRESQQPNNSNFLAMAYLGIGEAWRFKGDTDSSLWYAKRGLAISEISQTPDLLAQAYTSLSSIYKLRNNMDSAFFYQGLAMAEKDSINSVEKLNQFQNIGFDEQLKIQELEKEKIENQNKIRTYGLLAGLVALSIIAFIIFRNNQQKQKANKVLESTLTDLKSTQSQLIQSEKMASLGELTAGIAHEIQNPLNFVNNFSSINTDLIVEMQQEMDDGHYSEAKTISNDIKENEQKILHHGGRADAIVKGMLQHSRKHTGIKELTDINVLVEEYTKLAYHSFRAKDKTSPEGMALPNSEYILNLDPNLPQINIVPQDIGRVLLNLIHNAFYAVAEKSKQNIPDFKPSVSISTLMHSNKVEIKVKDNGLGIPESIKDKIFQPFFTTKPTGQGTGLGLSLAYDIVKAHGGTIAVDSSESQGTFFTIQLPIE